MENVIKLQGTISTQTRTPKQIIREGNQLGHSAKMIAEEVIKHLTEKLIEIYESKWYMLCEKDVDAFREIVKDGCS